MVVIRKIVLHTLVILIVLAFVTSCTKDSSVDEDVITVNFWHSMAGSHGGLIGEFAREFEQLHPGTRINVVYQGNYNQLHQKLIAAITSGDVPTVSQMYESWTVRFLRRDLLNPVEDYFSHPEYGITGAEIQDIASVFREDNTYKGTIVTLPFNKSAYVLFVNMDLLEGAGYTEPPKTWEEMRKIANDATQKDRETTIYGFAVRPFIESFSTLLYIAGLRFISDDGELVFDQQPAQKALQFLVDLVYEDKVAYIESDYLSTPFGAGRIAMFIGSTAGMPYIEKAVMDSFDWVVAPIPHPEEVDDGRVLFQGTNLGIFYDNAPEEKLMAWRFLRFMTDTNHAARWSIESGYLPIRYSCLNTREMKTFLKNNPNYRVITDQLDRGIFEPRQPYWELIRTAITDQVEAVLNGRRGVEEALEGAKRKSKLIMESL